MTTASTQLEMPSSACWLMDRSAAALRLSCATLTSAALSAAATLIATAIVRLIVAVVILLLLLLYLSVEYERGHRPQHHASQLSGHREAVLEGTTLAHSRLCGVDIRNHGVARSIPDVNPGDERVAAVSEHQPSAAPICIRAECGRAAGHRCVRRLGEQAVQTAPTDIPQQTDTNTVAHPSYPVVVLPVEHCTHAVDILV